jgi:hypothetical protein
MVSIWEHVNPAAKSILMFAQRGLLPFVIGQITTTLFAPHYRVMIPPPGA